MKKEIINIKTEREIKEHAKKIAHELGLSLSDVLNASLRNFIQTRRVVFSAIPEFTDEFERILGIVEKDIKTLKNISPSFHKTTKAQDYLDSLE